MKSTGLLAWQGGFGDNTRPLRGGPRCCGGPGGPPAMISSEPRQAWKGATVVTDSCAGVWLFGSPPFFPANKTLPSTGQYSAGVSFLTGTYSGLILRHVISGTGAQMASVNVSRDGGAGARTAGSDQCTGP